MRVHPKKRRGSGRRVIGDRASAAPGRAARARIARAKIARATPAQGENRGEEARGPANPDDRGPRARDDRGPRENRGPRGRQRGNDRDGFRKKPEPKLYRLESIIDHGFEEIADEGNEGAGRRIDWTILKRTTADQRTARALSATYVLRRDGVDTEFAHLSAARAAVEQNHRPPREAHPLEGRPRRRQGGRQEIGRGAAVLRIFLFLLSQKPQPIEGLNVRNP